MTSAQREPPLHGDTPAAVTRLTPRLGTLLALIVAAAASRLLPHPPNLTSVTAVALFGGAYFSARWLAFLAPLVALLASDLVLGLYPQMAIQYFSFALIICLGLALQRRRTLPAIAAAAIAGSVTFFVITNFGVWAFNALYPKTASGLLSCYVAGIPFFRNALLGDLGYTALLFGGFHLLERRFAVLQERGGAQAGASATGSSASVA